MRKGYLRVQRVVFCPHNQLDAASQPFTLPKHSQQNIKMNKALCELTRLGYSSHISRSLQQTWQNNEWNHSAVVAIRRYVTSYQRAAYHAQEVILSRDRLIISVFCVIQTSLSSATTLLDATVLTQLRHRVSSAKSGSSQREKIAQRRYQPR